MQKTEYMRTSPSQIMYQLATGYMNPFKRILSSSLALVAKLVEQQRDMNITDQPYEKLPFHYVPYKLESAPKVTLPGIEVAFTRPLEHEVKSVQAIGGEVRKISGQVHDIYHVIPSNVADLQTVAALENIRSDFRPTEGNISVPQILPFASIMTQIAHVADILYAISAVSDAKVSGNIDVTVPVAPTVTTTSSTEAAAPSSGSATQTTTLEVNDTLFLSGLSLQPPRGTWSPFVEGHDIDTSKGGIFVPFEAAYAEFDMMIAHHFVETFKSLFFESMVAYDDESSTLTQAWVGGIARTRTGQYLAHIMKVLMMAYEAGTHAQFAIRPDGAYQGGIIAGRDIMVRLVGKAWVEAKDKAGLDDEVQAFGSHNQSVRRILTAAGLTASTPEQFSTLRSLSQAVNASGEPSGMAKNLILKELPNVAFVERPTPVTAENICHTISLLTSDMPIPDDLYLDKGFFFPRDRYEAVLARFGNSAPSFCPGGQQEIRCCSILGRGVPDDLKYDRSLPPAYLQSNRIPVSVCANQWRDLLQHGHMRGEFKRRITGSRLWTGDDKALIWNTLDDLGRKVIIEKNRPAATSTSSGSGGGKRKEPDTGVVTGERMKKLSRFF